MVLLRQSGEGLLSVVALAQAAAADDQGVGVMGQAIQRRARQKVIVEDSGGSLRQRHHREEALPTLSE